MGEAEKAEKSKSVSPAEEQTQPKLPMDFFQSLLNLPSCKTVGVCDGCGRCER